MTAAAQLLTLLMALLALAVWLTLIFARGGFWLADVRDDALPRPVDPTRWPSVTAIVPARDEADVLPQSLGSLLTLDYPGDLRIVLVDDNSTDGTGRLARGLASTAGARPLTVIAGAALPAGWTGKLWAVAQGVDCVEQGTSGALPDYLLLTDADIAYRPDTLMRSVARAEAGGLVLVSLMARLRCVSLAERALIPAFVFFFQMLYPFRWVNDPASKVAAAAGGSMLVRRAALAQIGGIATIRDALIDDCALGARLKSTGPIWLGLTDGVHSLRAYPRFGDIAHMVSRSAYAELRYSPVRLTGAVFGMALVYIGPVVLAFPACCSGASANATVASWPASAAGLVAWALMTIAFVPILRFYRVTPLAALALPAIACAYLGFTLLSAVRHAQGHGGLWKGRAQAIPPVKGRATTAERRAGP